MRIFLKITKVLIWLILLLLIILIAFVYFVSQSFPYRYVASQDVSTEQLFHIQSVDTMKYSRDISRQVLDHPEGFIGLIEKQVKLIKDVGATHVAIATPYDKEFLPVLRMWVGSARKQGLSVWYRGNFSGWEGWFDYDEINREEHKMLLVEFIQNNPSLFVDGDIFSPCPECENGGPGDPRMTGDAEGYRDFLVDEKNISLREFNKIGRSVAIYTSMNGDIAREIITPNTVKSLGGTLLIDHYVDTTERFGNDIRSISKILKGKVGLGEFGAPIPDLQGNMNQKQQADFIEKLLFEMYVQREAIPVVNYWTLSGGSTAIVDGSVKPLLAYYTLQSYFKAPSVYGVIYNSLEEPVSDVTISLASTTYSSISNGHSYQIFLPGEYKTVVIEKDGYVSEIFTLEDFSASSTRKDIFLKPINPSWWFNARHFFYNIIKK